MKDISVIVFELLKDRDFPSDWAVVFPSRRQGFFLDRLLSKQKVVFPPKVFSLREFWCKVLSSVESFYFADFSDILCDLKDVCSSFIPEFNDWDCFYTWARHIFDTMELLQVSLVDESKLKDVVNIIVGSDQADLYFKIWANIASIMDNFYDRIEAKKMYTRALVLCRLNELFDKLRVNYKGIVLAGLFVESSLERLLLQKLRQKYNCFYIFLDLNVPGLRNILGEIKTKMVPDVSYNLNLDFDKISVIETASTIEELRWTVSRIDNSIVAPTEVAIILPRKALLLPLIDSLSKKGLPVNVSMGYPLVMSSVWWFIELIIRLMEGQKGDKFFSDNYLSLLAHYYLKEILIKDDLSAVEKVQSYISEYRASFLSLTEIERVSENNTISIVNEYLRKISVSSCVGDFCSWMAKFLWWILSVNDQLKSNIFERQVCYKAYLRFSIMAESAISKEKVSSRVIFRYIKDEITDQSIAFEGSPLEGVQLLEPMKARNLAFDTVFYLDLNEGFSPPSIGIDILMPEPIRKFLQIPRLRDRELLYCYDFYSIIMMAKRVFLLYVNYADGRYEKSRFLRQLEFMAESQGKHLNYQQINHVRVGKTKLRPIISRKKESSDLAKMVKLSPTAIDTYLFCPVRFYYKYILGIKEVVATEKPDERDIGILIHEVLSRLYAKVVGIPLSLEFFDGMKDKLKRELRSVAREFWKEQYNLLRNKLLLQVVENRLVTFFQKEKLRWQEDPFIIHYVELKNTKPFEFQLNLADKNITLYGRLDRIDKYASGEFVIWDYKTGAAKRPNVKKIVEQSNTGHFVFSRKLIKEYYGSMQLPIYILLLLNNLNVSSTQINAGWILLKDMKFSLLFGEDISYRSIFLENCKISIKKVLDEMFDLSFPYEAERQNCRNCPFRKECSAL